MENQYLKQHELAKRIGSKRTANRSAILDLLKAKVCVADIIVKHGFSANTVYNLADKYERIQLELAKRGISEDPLLK